MNKRVVSVLVFFLFSLSPGFAQYEEPVADTTEIQEEIPEVQNEEVVVQPSQFKRVDSFSAINERQLDRQAVASMKADEDFWYANTAREEEKVSKGWSFFDIDAIFWILLALAIIGLLVWVLSKGEVFRRNARIHPDQPEGDEENIYEINFEDEIKKAVTLGNYRLAVRLHYLQSLRALADRGLIQYATGKTNGQYLFELAGNPLYKNFFSLTRHFDYTWYGQFPLSIESYMRLERDFRNFKTSLHQ